MGKRALGNICLFIHLLFGGDGIDVLVGLKQNLERPEDFTRIICYRKHSYDWWLAGFNVLYFLDEWPTT
jgi:hypothetical protein